MGLTQMPGFRGYPRQPQNDPGHREARRRQRRRVARDPVKREGPVRPELDEPARIVLPLPPRQRRPATQRSRRARAGIWSVWSPPWPVRTTPGGPSPGCI